MGDYNIENVYGGGYSTFKQDKDLDFNTGFKAPTERLGAPTNPMTANQIGQVSELLQQGIVPIEIGTIKPDVFDQIPKTHFKEIADMVKLAGAKVSIHAPLVEYSGIDPQKGYDSNEQKIAENQLWEVVDRSAALHDKGNLVINAHAVGTNLPGTSWEMVKNPKTGKMEKRVEKIYAVDRSDGKVVSVLEREKKFYPGRGKVEEFTPEYQVDQLNHTKWDDDISAAVHIKQDADKLLRESAPLFGKLLPAVMANQIDARQLTPEQRPAYSRLRGGIQFIDDARQKVSGMFAKAYEVGSKEEKEYLEKLSNEYKEILKKGEIYKDPEGHTIADPIVQSEALQFLTDNMKRMQPKLFSPMEEYAKDKITDTLSNVAVKSFNKYKKDAPVLSFENFFADMAFGTGKEYRELIEGVRYDFVEKMKGQGMSESAAQAEAERMIGITLDVGHLNLATKKGFTKEQIVEEAKEWAPFVKHVHMTDNFGYYDSHLPPGMGTVPIKELMEDLEKVGFDKTYLVEAAGWPQHFGTTPFPHVLAGMGSEIYSGGPLWTQTPGLYEGYKGGFGELYPQVNYQMFGAQFSALPTELGGNTRQRGGFSGRGME